MIKYKLICKNCESSFDSWFSSSQEYEKLKNKNFLNCLKCNSKNVEKTLMAPKLINNFKIKQNENETPKYKEISKKIKEYQKFITKNFKYVGKNFAYEARSLHYDNKKQKKGIYGTASNKEIKELKEEGIDAEFVPWVKDRNN
tara:strand:- start:100 stop:528 length:429 start_codon:yes stop_codon:yes gene_type:complete